MLQAEQIVCGQEIGKSLDSTHLVGAQVLFTKLKQSYDQELGKKDNDVTTLRDQLFKLLQRKKSDGMPLLSKIVMQKVCLCLGYLVIKTTNSCWKTSVDDLLSFGSNNGPQECFISLTILKSAAQISEDVPLSPKDQAMGRIWAKENASKVFGFMA